MSAEIEVQFHWFRGSVSCAACGASELIHPSTTACSSCGVVLQSMRDFWLRTLKTGGVVPRLSQANQRYRGASLLAVGTDAPSCSTCGTALELRDGRGLFCGQCRTRRSLVPLPRDLAPLCPTVVGSFQASAAGYRDRPFQEVQCWLVLAVPRGSVHDGAPLAASELLRGRLFWKSLALRLGAAALLSVSVVRFVVSDRRSTEAAEDALLLFTATLFLICDLRITRHSRMGS